MTGLHAGFDGGALGFWVFLAAIIAVGKWADARKEAEKHETLRRIVDKTGHLDESRLKELFKATPASDWSLQGKPGDGYRGLRVAGTVVMFVAAGLATFGFILMKTAPATPQTAPTFTMPNGRTVPTYASPQRRDGGTILLGISGLVAVVGAGLFFSSRFLEPPPPRDGSGNEPPAR